MLTIKVVLSLSSSTSPSSLSPSPNTSPPFNAPPSVLPTASLPSIPCVEEVEDGVLSVSPTSVVPPTPPVLFSRDTTSVSDSSSYIYRMQGDIILYW